MWPFSTAASLLQLRKDAAAAGAPRPVATIEGHGKQYAWGPFNAFGFRKMHYGDSFYFLLGLAVWWFSWPDDKDAAEWPSLQTFVSSWVAKVLLRNLLLNIAIYEFWHQALFGILSTPSVAAMRFSAKDPYLAPGSVWRERFWSTCGFVWSTAWECLILHWWASGAIPACGSDGPVGVGPVGLGCRMATPSMADLHARPLMVCWFLLGFPVTTQFRGIHFFFAHRFMHPWWKLGNGLLDGDVGAFMYRHVHSLHHRSYNPGPWSSLSMHPVEHMLYFSCFLLARLVPYHPLHLLLNKYHTDISALAGHDGHSDPAGAADVGHYLHHAKFECNYGFSFPNYLDKLFGTFEDGTKYVRNGAASKQE